MWAKLYTKDPKYFGISDISQY